MLGCRFAGIFQPKKNGPVNSHPLQTNTKNVHVGKVPRCRVDEHVALPEDHANERPSELPAKMGCLPAAVIEGCSLLKGYLWTLKTLGKLFGHFGQIDVKLLRQHCVRLTRGSKNDAWGSFSGWWVVTPTYPYCGFFGDKCGFPLLA